MLRSLRHWFQNFSGSSRASKSSARPAFRVLVAGSPSQKMGAHGTCYLGFAKIKGTLLGIPAWRVRGTYQVG